MGTIKPATTDDDDFIDYAIDDGIDEGATNLDFRNNSLMRDEQT